MGLEELHCNAYGLNRIQHEKVVWAANNHYTESYIADKFNIPVSAVRDICSKAGIIPPRNENINGEWVCHPGSLTTRA